MVWCILLVVGITDCHNTGVIIKKEKKTERRWQSGTCWKGLWKAVSDATSCCTSYTYSFFDFFFFEKRKIDSMIRELKRKDFIYSMNFYFFFFFIKYYFFSLNTRTCTSPMPEYSQIYCNYILLCTLVTDKLDFKQARSIKGLSPHPLRILDLIPTWTNIPDKERQL